MMYEDAVGESAGLENVLSETIFSPQCPLSCQSGRKVACTVSFMAAQCLFTQAHRLTVSSQCSWNINMTPSGISDLKSELLAGRPRFTDHRHRAITICYIQGHARTYTHTRTPVGGFREVIVAAGWGGGGGSVIPYDLGLLGLML